MGCVTKVVVKCLFTMSESKNMSDANKKLEGLIPEGMVVSNVRGTVTDGLTVAGTVNEISDFAIDYLVVAETGKIESGRIEADEVRIEGIVANVEFNAKRLSVEAGAHVKDCDIRMAGVSGFSIDEKAVFDGDVKIAVSGLGGRAGSSASAGKAELADKAAKTEEPKAASSEEGVSSFSGFADTARAKEGSQWDNTPDISEANEDAHIPLGE